MSFIHYSSVVLPVLERLSELGLCEDEDWPDEVGPLRDELTGIGGGSLIGLFDPEDEC